MYILTLNSVIFYKDKRILRKFQPLASPARPIVCEYDPSLVQVSRVNKRQRENCANCQLLCKASWLLRLLPLPLIFSVSSFTACILHSRVCLYCDILNRMFRQVSKCFCIKKRQGHEKLSKWMWAFLNKQDYVHFILIENDL